MSKIILEFLKKSKPIILAIFIGIIIIGVVRAASTGQSENKADSPKKQLSENQEKKIIEDNKSKYGLKYDWLKANPQTLPVSTKSSIILDYNTGQILYAQNENEKLPPASITKVLTLVVALENMNPEKTCEISEYAANIEPNKIVMSPGEKLKLKDLLYGLMMISANDAAEAIAECYDGGRDAFMTKMNERVKLLGLTGTHFVNPNGLHDDNHLSSAYDMAVITNYGIKTQPDFLKYMGNKDDYSVYATENNQSHWWQQISTLLQTYAGMDGAKTGFTYEAGNTYVGTAQRDGRRIIIVYFNANSTMYDAQLLLDQGFYLNPSQ
jgi:D-alanyl-D-alanine carboxypeptidase